MWVVEACKGAFPECKLVSLCVAGLACRERTPSGKGARGAFAPMIQTKPSKHVMVDMDLGR